jgi:hypothetical protein
MKQLFFFLVAITATISMAFAQPGKTTINPDVDIVVPGHGPSGDAALLHHTVEMVQQYTGR